MSRLENLKELFPFAYCNSKVQLCRYALNSGKLPDFIIVGVQKGGTTSLWFHLKQHPDIEMSPNLNERFASGGCNTKEAHFFDYRWSRGPRWYQSIFNANGKLQGEATPNYLEAAEYHRRMSSTVPHAKMLRNPTARAYSAFNHARMIQADWDGLDVTKSFEENIAAEIRSGFSRIRILRRGFYRDHMSSLLRYYDRSRVLILISEQFNRDPAAGLNRVCDFLGIGPHRFDIVPDVHKRAYAEPMNEATRRKLDALYRPHNDSLCELLGHAIPEWEY